MKQRILLTGADSLPGTHILNRLLHEQNLSVRAVVGSQEEVYALQRHYHRVPNSSLDLVALPEQQAVASQAFDSVLNDHSNPFSAVIHALSAHHHGQADCLARFIGLETDSVISFLSSVRENARAVRRIVIVTSLTPFARWLVDPPVQRTGSGHFDTLQNSTNFDREYILATSQAGDNIVHDAISKWLRTSGAQFDVVYLTAPSVYGPTVRPLDTSSDILEANRRLWNICSNEPWERLRSSPYGIAHFLDVRDLAVCTMKALFAPHVGNRRLVLSAGMMPAGSEIADYLISRFPQLRGRIEMSGSPPHRPQPDAPSLDLLDTYRASALLGIDRYRLIDETITDTVLQILDLQRRKEWKRVVQS